MSCIGGFPLTLGRCAAAWKAATVLAAVDETKGVATSIFENELALESKADFVVPTCTELSLKISDSEESRLRGSTNLRLTVVPKSCDLTRGRSADLASETWLRFKGTCKKVVRHHTDYRIKIPKFCGILWSVNRFPSDPEFVPWVATSDRLSVTLSSDFLLSYRVPCREMFWLSRTVRTSSNPWWTATSCQTRETFHVTLACLPTETFFESDVPDFVQRTLGQVIWPLLDPSEWRSQ